MSSDVHASYPEDLNAAAGRVDDDGLGPPSPQRDEHDDEHEDDDVHYEDEADDEFDDDDVGAYDEYRTLSIAAVASLIFGILSLPLALPPVAVVSVLLVVPAMGALLGAFAWWNIASRPEEFTGKRLAMTGLGLSALMFFAAGAISLQLNKVAVPSRYTGRQVQFWELQPEEDININYLQRMRGANVPLPLPERALELDGQQVFITGYVYPGNQREGLDKFVLVRDMKKCCFGGQPKLTDMIEVTLADPLRVDYSMRRRGVGGTLHVHRTMQSRAQLTGVVYQLEADYLSPGAGVTGSAAGGS